MTTRHLVVDTTLGPITIVAGDAAVTGLYFDGHIRRPARATFGAQVTPRDDALLADAAAQVIEYLRGARDGFDLPISAAGNDFQHAVWDRVARIPFGQRTTYGAIADDLGDRALAYRVGQAVGSNPLCLIVPCHRVVGATGALTGYAGGLARKQALLDLEEPAPVAAGRLF